MFITTKLSSNKMLPATPGQQIAAGSLLAAASYCLLLLTTANSLANGQLLLPQLGLGALTTANNQQSTNKLTGGLAQSRDSGPEAMDIISSRGFIGERYLIRSKDGCPLSLYHIINPLANKQTLNKYPVLMFHGIGGDGAQMIIKSEKSRPRKPVIGQMTYFPNDDCLPFMLSNNNFDVWLVDARGTNLNNHEASVDYDLNKSFKYWNFSLDEEILLDTPTFIDFILAQTQSDKLHYIGFSQSTFFLFSLMSAKPEYQNKLASFVAMAPVFSIVHSKGLAIPLTTALALIPDEVNFNYMPQPALDTIGATLRNVCVNGILNSVCNLLTRTVSGGTAESSTDSVPFFKTLFKGTSIKVFKHFLQLFLQKRVGRYDYGNQMNLKIYGSTRPPDYNLRNVKLPTIITVRGGQDFLSNVEDQKLLLTGLGTPVYLDIFLPHYNHLDFLDRRTLLHEVYIPVVGAMIDILKQHSRAGPMTKPAVSYVVQKPIEVRRPYQTHAARLEVSTGFLPNVMQVIGTPERLLSTGLSVAPALTNIINGRLNGLGGSLAGITQSLVPGLG